MTGTLLYRFSARALLRAVAGCLIALLPIGTSAQSFLPSAVPEGEFVLARRQTIAPANTYGPYRLTRRADLYGALYEDQKTGELLYRQV